MIISTRYLWMIIIILLATSMTLPQLLINEQKYKELELSEAHKLLPKKLDLLELHNKRKGGYIISEFMPMAYVPEFKDEFLVTYDKYKMFIPVTWYFDWDRCGFDGKRDTRPLDIILECEPNSLIVIKHSSIPDLEKNYPDLKFKKIKSNHAYSVLRLKRKV